ncbi:MAG: DUF3127 domain-containing protein, partial [Flavobacterium sp.]|nr:DUF3127 domain-containing protein [Flavobacterium sp.]
ESREYNNKWYTDVKAWKIENASTSTAPILNNNIPIYQNFQVPEEDDNDVLPF